VYTKNAVRGYLVASLLTLDTSRARAKKRGERSSGNWGKYDGPKGFESPCEVIAGVGVKK
jgi:hypothetical protein